MSELPPKDDRFLNDVNQHLDIAEQSLGHKTEKALRQRRERALAAKKSINWMWPASGLATACGVAAIAFVLTLNSPETLPVSPSLIDDLEMLSSSEELEFYEQIDFYLWLEEDPSAS